MRRFRVRRYGVPIAVLGAAWLLLDAFLLLRAVVVQHQDTLPPRVDLIVLDAWSSDAATRLAFGLARRFAEAEILVVGTAVASSHALGGCFEGSSFGAKTRAQLIAWGLPAGRVVDAGQRERGTRNAALLTGAWIRQRMPGASALVVVTGDFHRQRSRLTYRHLLPGLDIRVLGPQPHRSPLPREQRLPMIATEFLKLAYYQWQGWISPLQLVSSSPKV